MTIDMLGHSRQVKYQVHRATKFGERSLLLSSLWENSLTPSVVHRAQNDPRIGELLHAVTLGTVNERASLSPHLDQTPGSPGFRLSLDDTSTRTAATHAWGCPLDAGDWICLGLVRGDDVPMEDLKLLYRLLGKDEPWAYTVVTATILGNAFLARGRVIEAARTAAKANEAHRRLLAFARKHRPGYVPKELTAYEQACGAVLDAFEPPIAHGACPVRKVRETVRKLRRRRPRRTPQETIDALDAVITAGESADLADLEARAVEQLARMLGGRVLLHQERGTYRVRESQQTHTLSSYTMLKLATSTSIRAHRIRRRPEFWRPEQRRPRGVLAFPIGTGHAAIARNRLFDDRDVRAVETILRFLDARRTQAVRTATPETPAEGTAEPSRARGHGLIGTSPRWRRVLDDVWRFGPTDCSIVIQGETGTGKEQVARALHANSKRAEGPFVAVNCAAVHGDTMLSELFGHVRGAFSGASESRDGLVRAAHRGTLFLDEVADMPHAMQVALLRTLQERRVRPVGSARTRPVDVRVLCATGVDLDARVRDGTFREDLYHRLDVVTMQLPPLRERQDDLPALSRHLLRRHDAADVVITPEAARSMAAHAWPGNVRELENVVRAALVLREGPAIDDQAIRGAIAERAPRRTRSRDAMHAGPRATRLLALLSSGWWSAPDLAHSLGVSTRTINRDLSCLEEQGLLVQDGSARARRYRALES